MVRFDGANYVKAQADSETNAEVIGIVKNVIDPDTFELAYIGDLTGLSGLTPGEVYYLSDVTAGLLTTTEPTANGTVSKPLLIANSSTTGVMFNFRGFVNGGITGTTQQLAVVTDMVYYPSTGNFDKIYRTITFTGSIGAQGAQTVFTATGCQGG